MVQTELLAKTNVILGTAQTGIHLVHMGARNVMRRVTGVTHPVVSTASTATSTRVSNSESKALTSAQKNAD